MKDHSIAYMAGLIDTDGTLGIYYKGESGYQASLEFYNDDVQLMKWVVEHFGGQFKPKKDPRRETIGYRWTPQGRLHLCRILDTLIPFLVLKKSEAVIVRQFLSISGEAPDLRKYLANTCRFIKGKRSIVETDTLRSLLTRKPNLIQAYVAGLIDGDGNIDTYESSVVIGFTNMCYSLIDELVTLYGGGWYQCKPTTRRWQLSGMKFQEAFLLKIIPYLELKKQRAKDALEFVRSRINTPRQFGRPCKELMIQSDLMGDHECDSNGS
jgi:hypothetical protein